MIKLFHLPPQFFHEKKHMTHLEFRVMKKKHTHTRYRICIQIHIALIEDWNASKMVNSSPATFLIKWQILHSQNTIQYNTCSRREEEKTRNTIEYIFYVSISIFMNEMRRNKWCEHLFNKILFWIVRVYVCLRMNQYHADIQIYWK